MWFCGAPNFNLGGPWWVGNTDIATPCRTGNGASFTVWPSANVGKVIQRPASTSSSASASPSQTVSQTVQTKPAGSSTRSTTSAPSSTANATLVASSVDLPSNTAANQPAGSSGSGNSLSLALGIGLGAPLGIASIGFLAFLIWKTRYQKQQSLPASDIAPAQNLRKESIDHAAREMSGGETAQEMWAKNPRQIPEIDSRQQHEIYTLE